MSLLFLTVLAPPTPRLSAQSPTAPFDERATADFYRGKIVRIVVGFPPGGGADVYSRVIARHLGRFVPGDKPLRDLPSANIPAIPDLTKDENHRMLLRYGAGAPNQFGKVYMLPTGVPPDRAAALEAAFAKTLADKNFLADAEKGKLEITPIFGDAIHRIVSDFLAMPPVIKERLSRAIKR